MGWINPKKWLIVFCLLYLFNEGWNFSFTQNKSVTSGILLKETNKQLPPKGTSFFHVALCELDHEIV